MAIIDWITDKILNYLYKQQGVAVVAWAVVYVAGLILAYKFIRRDESGAQIIVFTHSTILASKINLKNMRRW